MVSSQLREDGMTYESGGNLYPNRTAMIRGTVYQWWTAGGANRPEQVDAIGCSANGLAEADEMIEGWGLDFPGDDGEPSWTVKHQTTREELAEAITEFWATRPDRRTEEDED
jgi:hypothetical protein